MTNAQLLSRDACIALIFAPESRPSPRTWEAWKARRMIPYTKLGRLCYYDAEAVRNALATRFSVNSRPTA